jgi:hypothetical protein
MPRLCCQPEKGNGKRSLAESYPDNGEEFPNIENFYSRGNVRRRDVFDVHADAVFARHVRQG